MHTILEWGLQKRMAEVKSRYMLQENNQSDLKDWARLALGSVNYVVKNTTTFKGEITSTSLLLKVSFTLLVDNPTNTMNA